MFNRKIIFVFIITAVLTAVICCLLLYLGNSQFKDQLPWKKAITTIKEKNYVQLLFVGDLMFDRGIRYYAKENGGNKFIFDKISLALLSNDLVIANLEGPITDNKSISLGTIAGSTNNYYFTFDPSWAKTLFDNNIRLVNLGNNHILNFGRAGLASTKKYLEESKVDYYGSPDYLPPQRDPVLGGTKSASTEIGGVKITLISYNEFVNLDENIEVKSTIEEIKKATLRRAQGENDLIIVSPHWGIEYKLEASENQKDIAHQFIDAGADIIIGGHPHVIQQSEIYKEKSIYYSLGNFIFDQYFDENVRNSLGIIIKIDKKTKKLEFSEKRFYLDKNGQTIILE